LPCRTKRSTSGSAGYPGINVQVATTLDGRLIAVGTEPVHGARHDAHAYAASRLAEALATIHAVADLGYIGVEGIDLTPIRQPPGADLHDTQVTFNTQLSKIRAALADLRSVFGAHGDRHASRCALIFDTVADARHPI
jgi:hypothetical protein